MFSGRSAFGLRLAVWYAAVFTVSAMAIIGVTYVLAASSLAQRDRQILRSKVGEYATAYARGVAPPEDFLQAHLHGRLVGVVGDLDARTTGDGEIARCQRVELREERARHHRLDRATDVNSGEVAAPADVTEIRRQPFIE